MSTPPSTDKRILFVDSNASCLALAADLIEDQGYTVVSATTGSEALARLKNEKFDLLLTEILLAGPLDGLALLAAARAITRIARLPIIALSTHDLAKSRCLALRTGADAFVSKPFEPEELIAIIGAQLARVARSQPSGSANNNLPPTWPSANRVQLTPAEDRVLKLVSRGLANKAIAAELQITQRTVESHLSSVLDKTGLANRTQATRWALESGRG